MEHLKQHIFWEMNTCTSQLFCCKKVLGCHDPPPYGNFKSVFSWRFHPIVVEIGYMWTSKKQRLNHSKWARARISTNCWFLLSMSINTWVSCTLQSGRWGADRHNVDLTRTNLCWLHFAMNQYLERTLLQFRCSPKGDSSVPSSSAEDFLGAILIRVLLNAP